MFKTVWTSNDLAGASSLPPFPLGTIKGCSIRIDNQSPYALKVIDSQGTTVDYIRPYMYVVQPVENAATLSLQIDSATAAVVAQPYQSVSYRLIKGVVAYQTGSLWQQNMGAEIQGTANVNITNAQIEAAIQGTVTAIIQGAVTIANNNLNVTTQAGSQVTVANTIAANIQNASIDTNSTILNENITATDTFTNYAQPFSYTGTINAGSTNDVIISVPASVYDSVSIAVFSQNSQLANIVFHLDQIRFQPSGKPATYDVPPNNIFSKQGQQDNVSELQGYEPIYFSPTLANEVVIGIQNTSTNAITDTFTIYVFATKATTTVNNTTTNPALQQAVTGAYSTQQSFNQGSMSINTNYTLIPSSVGGYCQSLQVTYGQGVYNLYNGSQLIDSVNIGTGGGSKTYNFGSGVVNNGINVTCTSSTSTGSVNGFAAISQNTPPGVPKVIA